jgi:hypothetical protein
MVRYVYKDCAPTELESHKDCAPPELESHKDLRSCEAIDPTTRLLLISVMFRSEMHLVDRTGPRAGLGRS